MTRDNKVNKIREACIEANPEIVSADNGVDWCERHQKGWQHGQASCVYCTFKSRTIRLADILLAMVQIDTGQMFILDGDGLRRAQYPKVPAWNLRKDDLTLQPTEFINFIHSLLRK